MKRPISKFLAISFFCLSSQLSEAQKYFLHCGSLIDVKRGQVRQQMTIIVNENTIESVKRGYENAGKKDQLIDLRDKTVMPGFIDLHVHIESEINPRKYEEQFRLNDADVAFRSTVYAKRTLMAGFTTIRDLGGTGVNIAMRKAIDAGYIDGPRVYTAGKAIATTGGHADPSNGVKKELMGDPGPKEGVVNSPEDAKKAVRQRYKNGADLIKITATGGVLSVAKDGQGPQFTAEELAAIVETAADYNMITAAHAHGAEGMKRAVIAGITTIEHGTLMTEEVMDLMIAKGTYFVPTISAGKYVAEKARIPGYYPDIIVPKALKIGPQVQQTFQKAFQKGVKIAFGTDAGVFPHGENAKEFGYMVEAGMSPMKAIQSATIINAQVLKATGKIGSISKGLLADIVAVDENPVKNIKTLEQVTFVMKNGKIYKHLADAKE